MAREQTIVQTRDGDCPVHVFTPETGTGPWPGVIIYMDGLAIRPALFALAQRLADAGYVVLLPDLYYRQGPYEPLVPKEVFASGDVRAIIGPLMASTDNHRAADDTEYLLAWLDTRGDVRGKKIGTVGYCMGGGMALTVAGRFPERVAAAASFHGGKLATDDPVSPHLLAPSIRGEVYVGVADNDASYPPDMAERLEYALDEAGVTYESELYAGAAHGWTQTDFPVYDAAAAERAWEALLALYDRTLR